jgi:nucleotide-binding universal stress UspA family protein
VYQHILVATDGSTLSAPAIRAALALAKRLNAKLTCLHVLASYFPPGAAKAFPPSSNASYRRVVAKESRRALAAFDTEARSQGIAATSISVVGGEPWQAILRIARRRHCDLIVMASHGRGSLASLLLGSETTKVLAHSKTPVLVCRSKAR